MKVKIVNKSSNELPEYSTEHAAGMDLRANLKEDVLLDPLERKLIPTGLFIELPVGFEAQVRPRSGLALKKGITVLNSLHRECGVILFKDMMFKGKLSSH